MRGTLFVVATPIGNLEDMTFRAVRVLREASVVAAEDTRHTARLLRHFGIETALLSLHEHNETARVEAILGRLARGESVALVSDAGTPAVSDPGARLVELVAAAGFRVEPVPGASAVTAAVSAAGLASGQFAFLGFPPIKAKDRSRFFQGLDSLRTGMPVVFFEAPHRIEFTLKDLLFLANTRIIVFRELTKVHETTYRGTAAEIATQVLPAMGEFTIVVPRISPDEVVVAPPEPSAVVEMFGQLTDLPTRAAAKVVAERTGLTPNQVYDIVRRAKA